MKMLKLYNISQRSPVYFKDFGGWDMRVKPYSDTKANKLTSAIIDFIDYNGGLANRVSSAGRYIAGQTGSAKFGRFTVKQGTTGKWVPGSTNKGTADIHAVMQGRHISIEVKIGADRMSHAQHKEKARIEAAGGLYLVAKNMATFIEQWQALGLPMHSLEFLEQAKKDFNIY